MIYLGIDPGKKGFFALLNADANVVEEYAKIPTYSVGKSKREYDRAALKKLIAGYAKYKNVRAVVEVQGVRPNQGASSGFTTGYGYGLLVMALEGVIPYTEVRPHNWKKFMGITLPADATKGLSKDAKTKRLKAKSVAEAQRLFINNDFIPKGCFVPNGDYAEATLLALYGYRKRL